MFNKWVKGIFAAFLFFIVGLSISLIYFSNSSFKPYQRAVEHRLSLANIEYQGDLSSITKLIIAIEGKSNLAQSGARSAYHELSHSKLDSKARKNTSWLFNNLIWWLSFEVSYSETELVYLFLEFNHVNDLSNKYYGDSIINISFENQAQIIAMLKGPSLYIPKSEKGLYRLKVALDKYCEQYADEEYCKQKDNL